MSVEAAAPATPATFSRTAVIALVLAGLFSFSTLAVLSAYAPDLRRGNDGGAHALSSSAVGFAGLARLLEGVGAPVVISRGRPSGDTAQALLIVTPDWTDDADDIHAFRFAGPTLVVPSKWMVAPHANHPGWVQKIGGFPDNRMSRNLVAKLAPGARLASRAGPATVRFYTAGGALLGEARIDRSRSITGGKWTPVLVDEAGSVLMARDRNIFLLADPDLINTQALKSAAGARLAKAVVDQVRPAGGPVFFDVTLNGFERSRSLLRLAFEPPFLAATLCAVAAALLMGLHAAIRFGGVRREERALALGKTALADNQAALIRMAKREHRMAEPYALQVRDAVARAAGTSRSLSGEALETSLDRVGERRSGLSIKTLIADARAAGDQAALMAVARRLYQWKSEMTRERQ